MSREVALSYGGDFVLDATGDLLLVDDADGEWAALQQRVIQMLLTSPQLADGSGNVIPGSADDVFNPTAGAGLRRSIGNLENNALLAEIEARVMDNLALDPDVAPYPAPQLEFVVYPNGVVANLSLTAIDGQNVVFPPIPLTPAGS